jgi:cyclase
MNTISFCFAALFALLGRQQGPAGDAVETIQIRPNVYVIFGAGSNIVAHTGKHGVILVDSGNGKMNDRVLAAVQKISDKKIRFIINTNGDADHVGGNEKLAAAGLSVNPNVFYGNAATVLAHEKAMMQMSKDPNVPSEAQPSETFLGTAKSMYINDDAVQVIHWSAAHSDGDSIVHFRRADVIATGDLVDLRHFPVIDLKNGGTIQGELDALNRLIELAVPAMPFTAEEGRTLLVPGHGRIMDQADMVEYRDMVTVIRDVIQSMIQKGQTLEAIKKADPTKGYRTRYGTDTGPWTTDMFVEAVYSSLTTQQRRP